MLLKLGGHVSNCLERAAEAEQRALQATDAANRRDSELLAQSWRHLARSYQFAESLERFLSGAKSNKKGVPAPDMLPVVNKPPNRLLAALLRADPDRYSHFRTIDLRRGQVIAEPMAPIDHVYFPYSGVISFSVPLKGGHLVQAGLVGRDGAVGALHALDDKTSPTRIVVLAPGRAAVMEAETFRAIVYANPALRSLFHSHEQFFLAEVQQSVACNATHNVEQRMCRWIMRMNDLIGLKVPLTQELLSEMIAVRRTSISGAAALLQKEGVIRYRRGQIEITDLEGLKQSSCECYEAVNQHYHRIIHSHPWSEAAG